MKKIFKFIVPAIAIMAIIGCSNSPVSVEESSTAKTAALNSVQMQDIASCGEHIWGLSTLSAGNGNYYIYYYNTSTANWVFTANYGKKISVTPDGKCYHFNSNNNIWWCKKDGTNGSIPNPPQTGSMNDISSGGITGGGHSIWVIIGGFWIYKYTTIGGDAGWNNKTDYQTTGDFPKAIGCDPYAGEAAAIVAQQSGGMECYYYTGSSWQHKNSYISGMGYLMDVAIAGAWILLTDSYSQLYKNYNNQLALLRSSVRTYGVCGDNNYYYYLSNSGYVYRGVNTWN